MTATLRNPGSLGYRRKICARLLAEQAVQKQEVKMAMKVHSKNSRYGWHEIQRRHWFSHGRYLGLSEATVKEIIDELAESIKPAIEKKFAQVPRHFDNTIGNCIAENLRAQSVDLCTLNNRRLLLTGLSCFELCFITQANHLVKCNKIELD